MGSVHCMWRAALRTFAVLPLVLLGLPAALADSEGKGLADEVTTFAVEALVLPDYTRSSVRGFVKERGAVLTVFRPAETDPDARSVFNNRDLFAFRKPLPMFGGITLEGECWERSAADQKNAVRELLPNAKGIVADGVEHVTDEIARILGDATRMRNCDFLLFLPNETDLAQVDAAIVSYLEVRFGVATEREIAAGKDMGFKLDEPVLNGTGVIRHLSFKTFGPIIVAAIQVFSDVPAQ